MSSDTSKIVDFLFTGASVLPLALTFGGRFDLAFMIFCPLLITACLASVYLEGSPTDHA